MFTDFDSPGGLHNATADSAPSPTSLEGNVTPGDSGGAAGLAVHAIGEPTADARIRIAVNGIVQLDAPRADLHRAWSATTHALQRLRDNPAAADE